MKKYSFFIGISLVWLLSFPTPTLQGHVYARTLANHHQQKLEGIAYLLANPLFNTDIDRVKQILEFELHESDFKAFQIKETHHQNNDVFSYWNDNGNIRHIAGDLPNSYTKPSQSIEAEIIQEDEIIGKIIAYFEDEGFQSDLTDEEKAYIRNHPKVQIAMTDGWYPFSFRDKESMVGFSVDLIRLIEKQTGILFEVVPDTWTNCLAKFKIGKVEVIDSISYKPERLPFTLYTQPYYNIPMVIIGRTNFETYAGLESLKGKKVAITKDIFFAPELKKIDGIHVVEYDNVEDQIKALAYAKVDLVINNYTNSQQIITRNGYLGLSVLGELDIGGVGTHLYHLMHSKNI